MDRRILWRALLAAVLLAQALLAGLARAEKEATDKVQMARQALSEGRFDAAVDILDGAIQQQSDNHVLYQMRATCHTLRHERAAAVRDLGHVLTLRPDFAPALLDRARLLVGNGQFAAAQTDLAAYGRADGPDPAAAAEVLQTADAAAAQLEAAGPLEAAGRWDAAVEALGRVLEAAPFAVDVRLRRANAFRQAGQLEFALADLQRATHLDRSQPRVFLQATDLHLAVGELASAVGAVRDCLQSDPDQKECRQRFRELRRVQKRLDALDAAAEQRQWISVLRELDGQESLLAVAKEWSGGRDSSLVRRLGLYSCQGAAALKRWPAAVEACERVLAQDEGNADARIALADAFMAQEDYAGAAREYTRVLENDRQNSRAMEGLRKAQIRQRQASRRDYYKVLAVERDASQRDIKRAYRRLAQQWHPDKYQGDLPADQVQAKMAEVNQAYEVLSSPELRARFDAGEDPMSNEQQQPSGPFFQQQPFFFQGSPGGGSQFFGNMFGGGGGRPRGQQFRFQFGG